MLTIAVGAFQELTLPEELDRFVTPEPAGGIEITGGNALNDGLNDPTEGSDSVGQRLMESPSPTRIGRRGRRWVCQPEYCHAGAGIRAADETATGVTDFLTEVMTRALGLARWGAAEADEVPATAKPATRAIEKPAAAARRRAEIRTVVEVVFMTVTVRTAPTRPHRLFGRGHHRRC